MFVTLKRNTSSQNAIFKIENKVKSSHIVTTTTTKPKINNTNAQHDDGRSIDVLADDDVRHWIYGDGDDNQQSARKRT